MKSAWLSLLAAAACTGHEPTQVVTGTATTSSALAVRAVSESSVVAAARVRSDGTFSLALPAGKQYSLEVLAASGTYPIDGVSFRVCTPGAPVDLGPIGDGGGACMLPPPPPPPPPGCDPATDPNGCKPPQPPPPPPCDPTSGCPCPPPFCDPQTGSGSGSDVKCIPPPPPPCTDPTDPSTCQDPCMSDPSTCGCLPGSGSGSGSGSGGKCWPPPPPGAPPMTCAHPPGDIGCGGSNGS